MQKGRNMQNEMGGEMRGESKMEGGRRSTGLNLRLVENGEKGKQIKKKRKRTGSRGFVRVNREMKVRNAVFPEAKELK